MNTYENLRALIVWLGLTELAWIASWLLRPDDAAAGYVATVGVWIAVMLGWLVSVVVAARRDFLLKHAPRLSNLVGVALVVGFGAALFGGTEVGREGVLIAASQATHAELAWIHALRLLAIGTVIKYWQGELPLHFILLGAIPDFLFGASAVFVAGMADSQALTPAFLIAWHWVGFALFTGAGLSMFFSVPSPFRIFETKPDSTIVFRFPMALAPNFTVPLFMLGHILALVKLYA